MYVLVSQYAAALSHTEELEMVISRALLNDANKHTHKTKNEPREKAIVN
jgi:hypothetical protein